MLRLTGELSVEHHQLQAAMNSNLALQEEVATLQRTKNSLQRYAANHNEHAQVPYPMFVLVTDIYALQVDKSISPIA